jgi:hypothetical protein
VTLSGELVYVAVTARNTASQEATVGNLSSVETDVSNLQDSMGSVQNTLHGYRTCIPQIQQEIGGLSIQQQTTGGYVTNAYIQNPTIISQDCQRTLYGGR